MPPPDRLGCGLGQAKVAHLAGINELSHGAGWSLAIVRDWSFGE
jgi:hypothetical protein